MSFDIQIHFDLHTYYQFHNFSLVIHSRKVVHSLDYHQDTTFQTFASQTFSFLERGGLRCIQQPTKRIIEKEKRQKKLVRRVRKGKEEEKAVTKRH